MSRHTAQVTSVPLMIRQEVETRRARRKSPVRGRSPVKHRIPDAEAQSAVSLGAQQGIAEPHRVFRYIVTRRTIFSRLVSPIEKYCTQ